MLTTFEITILVLYVCAAAGLGLYGINCYVLMVMARRAMRRQVERAQRVIHDYWRRTSDPDVPVVTVQLPVFNERFVVGRLLHAVAKLDWPRAKLEVQVLDDSTDDTVEISRRLVEQYRAEGLDISLLHRTDRVGYKAGALEAGQLVARGEYIAIFDADFVPGPDFLRTTIPFFEDPDEGEKVAVVQGRWGHFNDKYSWLTRAQAVAIDGHFAIEQVARCGGGVFLNFNGTAGVWRKTAINDAGGWQHDTLTEDLDLSFRAQLKGWKIEFVPQVEVPAEIPANIPAFKSQQRRWAKGSTQTLVKLWRRVLFSREPWFTRVQGLIHSGAYFMHPLMLTMALLAWPLVGVWERTNIGLFPFIVLGVVTTLSTFGPSALYLVGQLSLRRDWGRRYASLPMLLVVGMGIAVSNTRAVLEGLVGIQSAFVRTPKDSLTTKAKKSGRKPKRRYRLPVDWVFVIEAFMCVWCALAFIDYIRHDRGLFAPYLLIFALGFGTMAVATAADWISGWFATGSDEDDEDFDLRAVSAAAVDDALAAWNPADHPLLVAATADPLPTPVVPDAAAAASSDQALTASVDEDGSERLAPAMATTPPE